MEATLSCTAPPLYPRGMSSDYTTDRMLQKQAEWSSKESEVLEIRNHSSYDNHSSNLLSAASVV
jgi:hypothetical protein